MEIILNEEDIKNIIKDAYKGVTEIKFSTKKLKITLIVNSDILNKNIKTETKKVEEKKTPTIVETPKVEPEVKGKLFYCPKLEIKWYLEVPFWRMVINSTLPTALLVAMQWVNYYFFMRPGGIRLDDKMNNMAMDPASYFGNALTLILTVIVLVPSAQEKASGRSYVNFVDLMMIFLVIGSGISAWAQPIPGFVGLLVSTTSLIFPLIAAWQYIKVSKVIRSQSSHQKISHFINKGKKRGEEMVISNWKDPEIPEK